MGDPVANKRRALFERHQRAFRNADSRKLSEERLATGIDWAQINGIDVTERYRPQSPRQAPI
jgi:hypothetical protein